MIKDFSNLTEGEHFTLYLVKRNFARYWICTGKQRTVWSFVLGYLQQKAMTKFYCLMKKYIYDCLDEQVFCVVGNMITKYYIY